MNKYFSIFFVFIALASCSKDGEAIHMTEVNNKWNKNQEQKFVLNIDDTQNPKDVIFVVRNNKKDANKDLIVNYLYKNYL